MNLQEIAMTPGYPEYCSGSHYRPPT